MQDQFNFNHRGLSGLLVVTVVVASGVCYVFEAWNVLLLVGFIAMVTGGGLSRVRVGRWLTFPKPTQIEGSIAAVGVALMFAAGIGFLAQGIYPWHA